MFNESIEVLTLSSQRAMEVEGPRFSYCLGTVSVYYPEILINVF
jgi:hypothetical protein